MRALCLCTQRESLFLHSMGHCKFSKWETMADGREEAFELAFAAGGLSLSEEVQEKGGRGGDVMTDLVSGGGGGGT